MTTTFLKIKIMSLAAEAKIIRAEEHKWPRFRDLTPEQRNETKFIDRTILRGQLSDHRRFDVRSEARSALLAYGFLRGRAYRRIEQTCHSLPNATRIAELITKFGGIEKKRALELTKEWLATASLAKAA